MNISYKKIVTSHDIYKNYWDFAQFMGQFALDADFDKFDNLQTIKEYNYSSDENYKFYLRVKSQADEILEMAPFPYDAIENATNLLISKGASHENEKIEKVKQWLKNVLSLLELRVTGKL